MAKYNSPVPEFGFSSTVRKVQIVDGAKNGAPLTSDSKPNIINNVSEITVSENIENSNTNHTFQIIISEIATVTIEGSNNNGITWNNLDSIEESGFIPLIGGYQYLRVNVSSYTSGTVSVSYFGTN